MLDMASKPSSDFRCWKTSSNRTIKLLL